MRSTRMFLTAAAIMGLLLAAVVLGATGRAQPYPPPVGSLSVATSTTTPSTGSTTTLTATVLDNAGNPVADAEVLFQIVTQPGADARFSNGQTSIAGKTGPDGIATATLSVGSTTGNILVKMIAGDKTSQLTLQVQGAPGAPPTGGEPPSEGAGGPAGWQAVLIAAGLFVLLAAAVILVRRRA